MDYLTQVEYEQSVGYMKPHLEALPPIHSLIDVGAAKGHFSLMFSQVFDTDQIIMIEANPRQKEHLDKVPFPTKFAAIGRPGKAVFYVNPTEQDGGGSSLFIEQTEWFDNPIEEEVDVVSLDDLKLSAEFIKIDVQGAEYDVLKYSPETIKRADYLLLELSHVTYNKDAPLIDDVLELTRSMGFRIIDTFGPAKGGHWHKGRKVQVDVLLAKESLPLFDMV